MNGHYVIPNHLLALTLCFSLYLFITCTIQGEQAGFLWAWAYGGGILLGRERAAKIGAREREDGRHELYFLFATALLGCSEKGGWMLCLQRRFDLVYQMPR